MHRSFVLLCVIAIACVEASNFAVLLDGNHNKVCSSKVRSMSSDETLDLAAGGRVRLMENGELDFDADGDFDACFVNHEVTPCDQNCTVRVPIRNDGPEDIEISDILLSCVDGNGEVISANPYISTDTEKRRRSGRRAEGINDATDAIRDAVNLHAWGFFANGNNAAGTRVRKGMQDLKCVSFMGEYQDEAAFQDEYATGCPAGSDLQIANKPTVVPAYSEVLVEVVASVPENVRVAVVASTAAGDETFAAVDLVTSTVQELLNMPYLCCLTSVRRRVFLGRVLADALVAYEQGDASRAIEILRFFINFASLAECDVTDAESGCLQEASAAALAAARLILEEFGLPEFDSYRDLGDYQRRRNQPEAAGMMYRLANDKHFKGMISQYPATYSFRAADNGNTANEHSNFGFAEITRG